MSDYWIQTFTHREIDLLDPNPDNIVIEDIAHALSLLCRFTGHTKRPYTVAQHSVLVCHTLLDADEGCSTELAFEGLMHDAAEAYLQDVSSPLKRAMRSLDPHHDWTTYDSIEERMERAIAKVFDLPHPKHNAVWDADLTMLSTEAKCFGMLAHAPRDWKLARTPNQRMRITPWGHACAERTFLGQFRRLAERLGR